MQWNPDKVNVVAEASNEFWNPEWIVLISRIRMDNPTILIDVKKELLLNESNFRNKNFDFWIWMNGVWKWMIKEAKKSTSTKL